MIIQLVKSIIEIIFCLFVRFVVLFLFVSSLLKIVSRITASLALIECNMLMDPVYIHVIELDPTTVIIWIVRVSWFALFDVAKVVAAVEGATVTKYGMQMIEVSATVLNMSFLGELVAIRTLKDLIKI